MFLLFLLHLLICRLLSKRIYSQLDTSIIRTVAKSQAKIYYRYLTEINSRYYGLSLVRTLTRGPYIVRCKGS